MNKKVITLNLTDCKTWDDFYERIRLAFGFPEWFGKNIQALWDLLSTECDADELHIIGESSLSKDLYEELSRVYLVLDKFVNFTRQEHEFYNDIPIFSYKIEN